MRVCLDTNVLVCAFAARGLVRPRAIASQNGRRAAGATIGGRPGERSFLRVDCLDYRLPVFDIVHLAHEVLRRAIESTQYASGDYLDALAGHWLRRA